MHQVFTPNTFFEIHPSSNSNNYYKYYKKRFFIGKNIYTILLSKKPSL